MTTPPAPVFIRIPTFVGLRDSRSSTADHGSIAPTLGLARVTVQAAARLSLPDLPSLPGLPSFPAIPPLPAILRLPGFPAGFPSPSSLFEGAANILITISGAFRPSTFLGPTDAAAADLRAFEAATQTNSVNRSFTDALVGAVRGAALVGRNALKSTFSSLKGFFNSLHQLEVSGVKPPAKPFYMGLVDVPGLGYINAPVVPGGEFTVTRDTGASGGAFKIFTLNPPESPQVRGITPAVLKFNLNPQDIILTYSKKVTAHRVRGSYFRPSLGAVTGHVIEHHWDELDIISITCKTGNFWVHGGLDYPRGERTGFVPFTLLRGFTSSRTKSLAYRKLQAIIAMFRNNGCSWLTGSTRMQGTRQQEFFGTDYNIVVNPGAAFLLYDGMLWYGHFENLRVMERGDMPHWFEFNLTFKVSRTVDLNGITNSDVLENISFDRFNAMSAPPPRVPEREALFGPPAPPAATNESAQKAVGPPAR